MNKINVLGVPISNCRSVDELFEELSVLAGSKKSGVITFVNPQAVYVCSASPSYHNSLELFDYVLCDGIGFVIAARRFGLVIPRASFDATSLSPSVFRFAIEKSIPVFVVGGAPGVAESAVAVLFNKYPGLEFKGVYSGYSPDVDIAFEQLVTAGYSIVIVGLGVEKQEDFLLRLKSAGWLGIGFTCGGYLDQVGVFDNYYPDWVDRLNVRFLYRIYREPRRLLRRYVVNYFPFIVRYFKTFIPFLK